MQVTITLREHAAHMSRVLPSILNWRRAGAARYAAVLNGVPSESIRSFDMYESPDYVYVMHTLGCGLDSLQVMASNLCLIDATAIYRNNPKWMSV